MANGKWQMEQLAGVANGRGVAVSSSRRQLENGRGRNIGRHSEPAYRQTGRRREGIPRVLLTKKGMENGKGKMEQLVVAGGRKECKKCLFERSREHVNRNKKQDNRTQDIRKMKETDMVIEI